MHSLVLNLAVYIFTTGLWRVHWSNVFRIHPSHNAELGTDLSPLIRQIGSGYTQAFSPVLISSTYTQCTYITLILSLSFPKMFFWFRVFWQHNITHYDRIWKSAPGFVVYYYVWRMRRTECGSERLVRWGREGGIMSCAWETYFVLTINYWILPAPFLKSFNYISGQKARHTWGGGGWGGGCHEEHKARTYTAVTNGLKNK